MATLNLLYEKYTSDESSHDTLSKLTYLLKVTLHFLINLVLLLQILVFKRY